MNDRFQGRSNQSLFGSAILLSSGMRQGSFSRMVADVDVLSDAATETSRSEDRPRYTQHLASAAQMLAAAHRRSAEELRQLIAAERRSFGWDFSSQECGARAEHEFNQLAIAVDGLDDGG